VNLDSLNKLYVESLKDLYSAEKQILQALPKMIKASSSQQLRQALEEHRAVTEEQVRRLEQIGEELGTKLTGHKCKAMQGIIEEGQDVLDANSDDAVRDAALIAAAQRVEHYEMAGYGCSRTYARLLGYDSAAELLQKTLDEEGDADKLLTAIAESMVNERAAMA
jgi:ferritin-like metal-binding protein YciE